MAACNKPKVCECLFTSKMDGSTKTITYVIRVAKHKAKSECNKYAVETAIDVALCQVK